MAVSWGIQGQTKVHVPAVLGQNSRVKRAISGQHYGSATEISAMIRAMAF